MSQTNTPSPIGVQSRLANMTIGRKLVAIVVLSVGFGFVVMIGVQITGERAAIHDVAHRSSLQATRLLATVIAGGVRWQQPDAIERSYRSYLEEADAELASIVTLGIDGQILTEHKSEDLQAYDLGMAIEDARQGAGDRYGLYTARYADHIVVVAPVLIGRSKTRVGTLAVAWSLEEVNALIRAGIDRQAVMAGFSLLALIILLVMLLHHTVSFPLRAVSAATIQLSKGDRSTSIPETARGDEIGEMARALEVFRSHILMIDQLTAEQKEDSKRLAEALEKERKYNALHREFVAMASHEFRTPLAIIDGAAQRITRRAESIAPAELLERVDKIRHAVTRMIGLIDSTLNASRMEAGRIELATEVCDLHGILEATCRRQQEIAPEHFITLDVGKAPKRIVADPKQLDQVLTNLLSNAVKYSPNKAPIGVTARAEGKFAVISIHDQGVGIPADEIPKLFERFFRATTATGIPGTGIGLNLVKQLVEMHGGTIHVVSTEGHGSTFSARLPIAAAAEGVVTRQAEIAAESGEAEVRSAARQ